MDSRYVKRYKDLDLNFIAHPRTGDVSTKEDLDALKQSIKTLVLTQLYERPFRHKMGSRVYGMLFENFNFLTKSVIETEIRNVINNYEPRANVMNVLVSSTTDNNDEDYTLNVEITFRMKNSENPVKIDFILERTR